MRTAGRREAARASPREPVTDIDAGLRRRFGRGRVPHVWPAAGADARVVQRTVWRDRRAARPEWRRQVDDAGDSGDVDAPECRARSVRPAGSAGVRVAAAGPDRGPWTRSLSVSRTDRTGESCVLCRVVRP